ncbi:MAG: cadmium-translocating P-type ATPase [Lachnospiraceae bacterium]|nr:cadmium-translocating P-type ATPase [Lachnospiraceae bacterium]
MNKKQRNVLKRIIVSALLLAVITISEHVISIPNPVLLALYMVPYLIIGGDILKKAFLGIKNGQIFDENFLMAVATIGAILLGLVTDGEEGGYLEGVAVMLFYQTGELFQSVAVGKSRKNITALMDIRPDTAHLIAEDGTEEDADPDDIPVGSIISVHPGERIPIDGKVIDGSTTLDMSALTGESVPVSCKAEDNVLSGAVNLSGLIKIETSKEFGESTVSRILDMVENSAMKKSRSENFITKFAHVYTPAVCGAALILAVLPPVINTIIAGEGHWTTWIIRALTFLVISCPCALVISIPLSFFGGIGAASTKGILVKGSNYLEALSETGIVVFDKTGTLTRGVFSVTAVRPSESFTSECNALDVSPEDSLLLLAGRCERYTSHPIGKSIIESLEKKGLIKDENTLAGAEDIEEISGRGIKANIGGRTVYAGNSKLMDDLGADYDKTVPAGTVVYVCANGAYAGYILISDIDKDTSKAAIKALKRSGIRKTVMLTGDNESAASEVAERLGLDEHHSGLLPGDKVDMVESLLAGKRGKEKLAFVGDGINDAPVLSRADIGIAMGALGSDAAIEAADVVLMDDDPLRIALAMKISRRCLRIVKENIFFALFVKAICLALGAVGIANMWLAIFADVGVMVLAVLNSIRCLSVKE